VSGQRLSSRSLRRSKGTTSRRTVHPRAPRRTTGPEVVFEDPLAERLGDHRQRGPPSEQAFDDGQVGGVVARRDAIDHVEGKLHAALR